MSEENYEQYVVSNENGEYVFFTDSKTEAEEVAKEINDSLEIGSAAIGLHCGNGAYIFD
jgi:hypothetical protein